MNETEEVYLVIHSYDGGDCPLAHVFVCQTRGEAEALLAGNWVEGYLTLIRGVTEVAREVGEARLTSAAYLPDS